MTKMDKEYIEKEYEQAIFLKIFLFLRTYVATVSGF